MVSDNEYMRKYSLKRYHELRAHTVDLLGGKCVMCSSTELLEIDHIDRSTKEFDLGKEWATSYERYLKEVSKCQLLCRACHSKKSANECSVDHGGGLSGKKNCPCILCKKRKAEYMMDYERKRRNRK